MIGHNHASRLGVSPGFTWDQWRLPKQFKCRKNLADLLRMSVSKTASTIRVLTAPEQRAVDLAIYRMTTISRWAFAPVGV